jgi:hypothetical protein
MRSTKAATRARRRATGAGSGRQAIVNAEAMDHQIAERLAGREADWRQSVYS